MQGMGYLAVALPAGATTANYKSAPTTLRDFLTSTGRTFHLYLSNIRNDCHHQLAAPTVDVNASKFDHFAAITQLFVNAKNDMSSNQFNLGLQQLAEQFWPSEDVALAHVGIQRLQFSPSRSTTPKTKESYPESSRRINQRRINSLDQEREEAQTNLQYIPILISRRHSLSISYIPTRPRIAWRLMARNLEGAGDLAIRLAPPPY